MNIRQEINDHSPIEERENLLWLFERYHMASQWKFVAKPKWGGSWSNGYRIWHPTDAGKSLFQMANREKIINNSLKTLNAIYQTLELGNLQSKMPNVMNDFKKTIKALEYME